MFENAFFIPFEPFERHLLETRISFKKKKYFDNNFYAFEINKIQI